MKWWRQDTPRQCGSLKRQPAAELSSPITGRAWSISSPNEEVLLPKDAYEVAQIIRTFSDLDRTRMGLTARERILSAHTSAHRAIQFEQIVSRCGGNSQHLRQSVLTTKKDKDPAVPAKALRASVCP